MSRLGAEVEIPCCFISKQDEWTTDFGVGQRLARMAGQDAGGRRSRSPRKGGGSMDRVFRALIALSTLFLLSSLARQALAEDLEQAWGIALRVNDRLQSQQFLSTAAVSDLSAAKRARLPTVSTQNYNFLLTNSPTVNLGSGVSPSTGLPHYFPALGQNQNDLPISFTFATLPLYTGGKLLRDIDAAGHRVATQRNEESRTALDLKLVVAESYVGVLRARRNLEVAKSNVKQLSSFAKDVKARREQGLAIRSDDLAAEVSLRNAQIGEIQAKNALKTAWATYNRYLCRPLATVVDLDELSNVPALDADWKALPERAMEANSDSMEMNESELDAMTRQAMRRPELASLTSQARTLGAQAESTLSNIRPQVGIGGGFAFLGAVGAAPQGYGAMMLSANWTFTDSGATRRRAAAIRQREFATLKQRADLEADIALQVRTRWLDLQTAHMRVPVARVAVAEAEENNNVLMDRYRHEVSTYTEVLDAETRRVLSLTNFYNSLYDESLAFFRLRRAIGDL
jgi:outer membrane protein